MFQKFFIEEVILLGHVFSDHQNEEDLMFRCAKMLDWIYRRYTGQTGDFENQLITQLLKQPFTPHPSTLYLLEKHFPELEKNRKKVL
jgi:hypothetical protein